MHEGGSLPRARYISIHRQRRGENVLEQSISPAGEIE